MFGTNPFTIGVPTDEAFDFNFDCATSITQNGKVEYYERIGEEVHPGTIIANDGSAAVVVEVQESGYTLSFSVSNSDAMKVKVGDTATVSDTYWGQKIGAVLKTIVPDAGGQTDLHGRY
jgi:hypothetical protein